MPTDLDKLGALYRNDPSAFGEPIEEPDEQSQLEPLSVSQLNEIFASKPDAFAESNTLDFPSIRPDTVMGVAAELGAAGLRGTAEIGSEIAQTAPHVILAAGQAPAEMVVQQAYRDSVSPEFEKQRKQEILTEIWSAKHPGQPLPENIGTALRTIKGAKPGTGYSPYGYAGPELGTEDTVDERPILYMGNRPATEAEISDFAAAKSEAEKRYNQEVLHVAQSALRQNSPVYRWAESTQADIAKTRENYKQILQERLPKSVDLQDMRFVDNVDRLPEYLRGDPGVEAPSFGEGLTSPRKWAAELGEQIPNFAATYIPAKAMHSAWRGAAVGAGLEAVSVYEQSVEEGLGNLQSLENLAKAYGASIVLDKFGLDFMLKKVPADIKLSALNLAKRKLQQGVVGGLGEGITESLEEMAQAGIMGESLGQALAAGVEVFGPAAFLSGGVSMWQPLDYENLDQSTPVTKPLNEAELDEAIREASQRVAAAQVDEQWEAIREQDEYAQYLAEQYAKYSDEWQPPEQMPETSMVPARQPLEIGEFEPEARAVPTPTMPELDTRPPLELERPQNVILIEPNGTRREAPVSAIGDLSAARRSSQPIDLDDDAQVGRVFGPVLRPPTEQQLALPAPEVDVTRDTQADEQDAYLLDMWQRREPTRLPDGPPGAQLPEPETPTRMLTHQQRPGPRRPVWYDPETKQWYEGPSMDGWTEDAPSFFQWRPRRETVAFSNGKPTGVIIESRPVEGSPGHYTTEIGVKMPAVVPPTEVVLGVNDGIETAISQGTAPEALRTSAETSSEPAFQSALDRALWLADQNETIRQWLGNKLELPDGVLREMIRLVRTVGDAHRADGAEVPPVAVNSENWVTSNSTQGQPTATVRKAMAAEGVTQDADAEPLLTYEQFVEQYSEHLHTALNQPRRLSERQSPAGTAALEAAAALADKYPEYTERFEAEQEAAKRQAKQEQSNVSEIQPTEVPQELEGSGEPLQGPGDTIHEVSPDALPDAVVGDAGTGSGGQDRGNAEDLRPSSGIRDESGLGPVSGGVDGGDGDTVDNAGGRGRGDGRGDGGLTEPTTEEIPENAPKPSKSTGQNFRITEDTVLAEGGPKQRFRNNVAAIRLLKQLEAEDRDATPEEQAILARYVGWGASAFSEGLFNIGKGPKPEWESEYNELQELLTESEFASAASSITNAHYTSREVITGIWRGLEKLGLLGGSILEPAAGVGHFFGLMPQSIAEGSRLSAVEKDSISARITKKLYPGARVAEAPFESRVIAYNSTDLVISNVPFASVTITDQHDAELRRQKLSLHNYFIAKSIKIARPGGLVVVITTHHTMDAPTSSTFRASIAKSADLVGAVRLPNTTFKQNASTEVVTDILIFQKHGPGSQTKPQSWVLSGDLEMRFRKYPVNNYFLENPNRVLGEHSASGSMYGPDEYTVENDQPVTSEMIESQIADMADNVNQQALNPNIAHDNGPVTSTGSTQADNVNAASNQTAEGPTSLPGDAFNALSEGLKGLDQLFGGGNKAFSGIPVPDKEDWKKAKPHFMAMWKSAKAAGLKFREFVRGVVEQSGDRYRAFLNQLAIDLGYTDRKNLQKGQPLPDTDDEGVTRLGPDGMIHQFIGGEWQPYYKDSTEEVPVLDAEGKPVLGKNGKPKTEKMVVSGDLNKTDVARVAMLGRLRDVRRALAAAESSADSSIEEIEALRAELNEVYDAFVAKYKSLHDTSNMNLFQYDSYASLVLALENYSEQVELVPKKKGQGFTSRRVPVVEKADIFRRRMQAPPAEVSTADSPEHALLLSVQKYGTVNFSYVASLLGEDESNLPALLTGKAYETPNGDWVIADEYLSGNVRQKLHEAEQAAEQDPKYQVNVDALRSVVPADIPAELIRPRLGEAWIEVGFYTEFFREITGDSRAVVFYSEALGRYEIRNHSSFNANRAKYTNLYGTTFMTADEIFLRLMHAQSAKVSDKTAEAEWQAQDPDGYAEASAKDAMMKIDDPKATPFHVQKGTDEWAERLSREASAKAREVQAYFERWLFSDPTRKKYLVRQYNEEFNNFVKPKIDGSHLTFPGMTPDVTLYPHQRNAIWQYLRHGNLWLAHVVGAGKTFTMIAAAIEAKRLGLTRKTIIAVPTHLIGQWSQDVHKLYPGARVLLPGEKSLEKSRRKMFLNMIANNDYDIVILGHSHLKAMPVHIETVEAYIDTRIQELTAAIVELEQSNDRSDARTAKKIQKQIDRLRNTLENARAEWNKDQGVMAFEDLGVDSLFIDEAHEFRSLYTPSMQSDLLDMPKATATQKTMDLHMKTEYLNRRTNQRGIIMATGTPIARTIGEIHIFMRYLQPHVLIEHGLEWFDRWSAQFADIAEDVEYHAHNEQPWQIRRRLAKLRNVPELIRMLGYIFDPKTARSIGIERPNVIGGEPEIHEITPSRLFKAFMTDILERTKTSLAQGYGENHDPIFNIISDGARGAVDLRLSSGARDAIQAKFGQKGLEYFLSRIPEGSKIPPCCERVKQIYDQYSEQRGTQVIWLDQGVPGSTNPDIPNLYRDIKNELVRLGIPEHEIDDTYRVHGSSKAKKIAQREQRDKMNAGAIRVLIASSNTLGTGANIQKRLIAAHHLDNDWNPHIVEQRDGRILRPGNMFSEVHIIRYVVPGSLDSYKWKANDRKLKGLHQFLEGALDVREIDIDTQLSANKMQAAAIGDEDMMELIDLENDVKTLETEARSFSHQQNAAREMVETTQRNLERRAQTIQAFEADVARVDMDQKPTADQGEFEKLEDLGHWIRSQAAGYAKPTRVGQAYGFELLVHFTGGVHMGVLRGAADHTFRLGDTGYATIVRIRNEASGMAEVLEFQKGLQDKDQKSIETLLQQDLTSDWPKAGELSAKRAEYEAKMTVIQSRPQLQVGSGVRLTEEFAQQVDELTEAGDPDASLLSRLFFEDSGYAMNPFAELSEALRRQRKKRKQRREEIAGERIRRKIGGIEVSEQYRRDDIWPALRKSLGTLHNPQIRKRFPAVFKLVDDLVSAELFTAPRIEEAMMTFRAAAKGLTAEQQNKVRTAMEAMAANDVGMLQALAQENPQILEAAKQIRAYWDAMRERVQQWKRQMYQRNVKPRLWEAFVNVRQRALTDKRGLVEVMHAVVEEMNEHARMHALPTITLAELSDLFDDYMAVDRWGLDDYITNIERGQVLLIDQDGHVRAVGVTKADALRKAKEEIALAAQGDRPPLESLTIQVGNGLGAQEMIEGEERDKWLLQKRVKAALDQYGDEIGKAMKADIAARVANTTIKVEPTNMFSGPMQHRDGQPGLKGEQNLFDVLPAYAYIMERKMAFDPVLSDIRKAERDLPPNLREALLDLAARAKGKYSLVDQVFDDLLRSFKRRADYWLGTESELQHKPRAASRASSHITRAERILKLGYRPAAALINKLGGEIATISKVGARYRAMASAFADTEEGRRIIAEELHMNSLGTSVAADIGGPYKAGTSRLPFYHYMKLFDIAERSTREKGYLANYLWALDQGMDPQTAREDARVNTRFQQVLYVSAAIPKYMDNPAGRVIFQFKTFLVKHAEFLLSMTPAQIARYSLMMWAVGGTNGAVTMLKSIPLVEMILGSLLDDLDEWLDYMHVMLFHKTLGFSPETALSLRAGVPGLLGADISTAAVPQIGWEYGQWAGPFGSDLMKAYRNIEATLRAGGQNLSTDRPFDNVSDFSPMLYYGDLFWQSVVNEDGWLLDEYGKKLYKLPAWDGTDIDAWRERAYLLAGIQPVNMRAMRKVRRSIQSQEQQRKDNVARLGTYAVRQARSGGISPEIWMALVRETGSVQNAIDALVRRLEQADAHPNLQLIQSLPLHVRPQAMQRLMRR